MDKSMTTMKRSHGLSISHDFPVKLEVPAADAAVTAAAAAEEQDGGISKRSRLSPSSSSSMSHSFQLQQWSSSAGQEFSAASLQHNPLAEPSPLGLRLRKSPSLLDLIQMKLSGNNALPVAAAPVEDLSNGVKKDVKLTSTSSASDKLKASNFLASSLRIGSWEFIAKHEGDLVAKCYFAKKKLVWEVLKGGLKSKIEIQWGDIVGLKANCPDDCPGTLTVVLARQPLFFRETNPQPRKHTLWQASPDFTEGQASINRRHVVQCPPGLLTKHFEKLILSDSRLNFLNQQNESIVGSLYFDSQASIQENPERTLHNGEVSPVSCFPDGVSPSLSELSSLNSWDAPSLDTKGTHSPSSVVDGNAVEGSHRTQSVTQTLKNSEQYKVFGLRPSISMSDLVNHIGNQISARVTSGNIPSEKATECKEMLENVAQMLLSDTQNGPTSDEKLMKKVNSLCCLLQEPVASENNLDPPTARSDAEDFKWDIKGSDDGLPRNDSFGDLLFHLPRIASFPTSLFDIEETVENQFR